MQKINIISFHKIKTSNKYVNYHLQLVCQHQYVNYYLAPLKYAAHTNLMATYDDFIFVKMGLCL